MQSLSLGSLGDPSTPLRVQKCVLPPSHVAQPFIHWVGVNRCDVQALGQTMQL